MYSLALLPGCLCGIVIASAQQLRTSEIISASSGSGQVQLGIDLQSINAAIKGRTEKET